MTTTDVQGPTQLDQELAGLDALELPLTTHEARWRRVWRATWPKVGALLVALGLWQLVVWSGWKPEYVLPGPRAVWDTLKEGWEAGTVQAATVVTVRRALVGFTAAVVIGTVLGALVARSRILRSAIGSLITGLQTMPSIAWFPLAILLFKLSEQAIFFVVIMGAAPAIANGLINGADNIPPIMLRAGRVLGARGFALYRHVILPASFPAYLAGLKQGWAFSWRSLLAGELLVPIARKTSIGLELQNARQFSNADGVLAMMVVILVIGIVVDALFFGTAERWTRRRWGLEDSLGS